MEFIKDLALVVNNYAWFINIFGLILSVFLAIKSITAPFTGEGGIIQKLLSVVWIVILDFIVDTTMIIANGLNIYHIWLHPENTVMTIWWAVGWFALWALILMPAKAGLRVFGI